MKVKVLSSQQCEDENANNGDCFILDDGRELVLYDCGCEDYANYVINYMKEKGYEKVKIVLSHNDDDHFKGIPVLIENGKVARPYIGMSGRDISEEVAKKNNLPKAGVYVVSVEEFSAAEKAGIKAGDLIVAFDGEDVTTMDKLNELKNKHNIGDEVKIKLIRNGEEKEVSITLGENKSTNEQ